MIVKNYLKRIMPSLSSVAFMLVCFIIASPVRAVVPAPDGGYPGFNTAEGQNALFNLTTGVGNTAVGWFSLWSDTDGSYNTAVGAGTLLFNVGNQSTGEGAQNTAIGTAAVLGLARYRVRLRRVAEGMVFLPAIHSRARPQPRRKFASTQPARRFICPTVRRRKPAK